MANKNIKLLTTVIPYERLHPYEHEKNFDKRKYSISKAKSQMITSTSIYYLSARRYWYLAV